MKNTLNVFGIIAFVAIIGFSSVGCASFGGSGGGGGGGGASNEARLTAVPAGNVPANLVGTWYDDARKRRGDFVFEITADGKIVQTGGVNTIYADETHLWLMHPQGGEISFTQVRGERTPYRISGNNLYLTMIVMGHTIETQYFR